MPHTACQIAPANQGGCTRRYPRVALERRASFWASAGVVAHTLWTSAAAAMTYRPYASEWHLTSTTTAAIFAIYPVVVVGVLILFGGLSDQIGRRATMLLGLGASFLGALILALAPNVPWLFVARAFMGVGVGLTAGPSTAAMVDFNEGGPPRRASVVATAAQAAGFAAALIVGGALTQYVPWPLHLVFWLLAFLIAALFTRRSLTISFGASNQLAALSAATSVCPISVDMVIGPTPPGTGVNAAQRPMSPSWSTSPTPPVW